MLYWAYGSNLNKAAMSRRCPGAKPFAPLTVPEARLVFRGVADVITSKRLSVPGALWRITREDEQELDAYEGVGAGLYAKRYLKLRVNGDIERALFYVMCHRGITPPSEVYLDTIIQGYRDWGLDLAPLEAAVQHSWDRKHKTPFLRRRHVARGRQPVARRDHLETDL